MNRKEILKTLILLDNPEIITEVKISRTKTSKLVDSCAEDLAKTYQKYFDLILKNNMSIISAKQQFGQDLENKTKHCIQMAWFAGKDYVQKQTGHITTLTVYDVQEIENLTAKTLKSFFDKIYSVPFKYEFFSIGQLTSWIFSLPNTALYGALNNSTISSLNDLQVAGQISKDENTLIYITEDDEKVCNICYPLHQKLFYADEQKPNIPEDTHPNCRCRLLVYDENTIY